MAEGGEPKKAKAAEGGKPAGSRPVKRDAAEAKARREAAEAEAAASEETEEEEDAVEGTDEGSDEETGEEEAPEEEKPAARPRRGGRRRRAKEEPEEEEDAGARRRVPRPRPALSADTKLALEQRKEISSRRPEFHRQEWYRYQRLGDAWRAPQGIQSKQRRHWKSHPDVVSIGFRGPRKARALHPSGFREVLVENEAGLEAVDRKSEAVRIAAGVGERKRLAIQRKARKMGIRVLNWRSL